jgi:hypothetical protein
MPACVGVAVDKLTSVSSISQQKRSFCRRSVAPSLGGQLDVLGIAPLSLRKLSLCHPTTHACALQSRSHIIPPPRGSTPRQVPDRNQPGGTAVLDDVVDAVDVEANAQSRRQVQRVVAEFRDVRDIGTHLDRWGADMIATDNADFYWEGAGAKDSAVSSGPAVQRMQEGAAADSVASSRVHRNSQALRGRSAEASSQTDKGMSAIRTGTGKKFGAVSTTESDMATSMLGPRQSRPRPRDPVAMRPNPRLPQSWERHVESYRRRAADMPPALVVDCLKRLAAMPDLMGREHSIAEKLGYLANTGLRNEGRKATRADKIGDAIAAHPELRAAAAGLHGTLWELLQTAARDEATFSSDFWMSQLATAQLKLRIPCEDFWWRLDRKALSICESRQASTLLHRRVALGAQKVLPPPGKRTWTLLLEAITRTAPSSNPQNLTSALWACGKAAALQWPVAEPSAEMSSAVASLLAVLPRQAPHMNAREVATSWWALSELLEPLDARLVSTLNAAVVRMAYHMNGPELATTARAYARMQLPLQGTLRRVLLQEIVRRTPRMSPQAVANSVWALGHERYGLPESVHTPLVAALQRTVYAMSPTELHSSISGLARMPRSPAVPEGLRLSIVAAFESVAEDMDPGQRASVIRRLEGLGWVAAEPGGGARSWFGGLGQWIPLPAREFGVAAVLIK